MVKCPFNHKFSKAVANKDERFCKVLLVSMVSKASIPLRLRLIVLIVLK